MNYYLKYHIIQERAFMAPILVEQAVSITAYSLHEAWSEAMDHMEVQRKFSPIVFISLESVAAKNATKFESEMSEHILPKTL